MEKSYISSWLLLPENRHGYGCLFLGRSLSLEPWVRLGVDFSLKILSQKALVLPPAPANPFLHFTRRTTRHDDMNEWKWHFATSVSLLLRWQSWSSSVFLYHFRDFSPNSVNHTHTAVPQSSIISSRVVSSQLERRRIRREFYLRLDAPTPTTFVVWQCRCCNSTAAASNEPVGENDWLNFCWDSHPRLNLPHPNANWTATPLLRNAREPSSAMHIKGAVREWLP